MISGAKSIVKYTLKSLGNSRLNRSRLQRSLAGFDRVNVGCGEEPGSGVAGWLNIGLFSLKRVPYGTLKSEGSRHILHFDMTKGIPIPDNSVQFLYSSHFIEHLSFEQGGSFLSECYRVMQPGGHIRITCPNLGLWIQKYGEDDQAFFENFYAILPSYPGLRTRGQILVGQIQGWGHRWLYDFESISDVMERAGFSSISQMSHHQTAIPDIERLEPNDPERILETLYVEAVK